MEQFEIINGKLDKLDSRIDNIDITLAKQSVILEDHQRRSIANEANVEMLRKDDVAPMQVKWANVEGALKLLGGIAAVVGVIAGVVELISAVYRFFQ